MALPISITLVVLVAYFFFFMKKSLTFLHNLIIFMVITILTRNVLTIVSMELKRFSISEEDVLNLVSLLDREILVPLVVLIFVNEYLQMSTILGKAMLFLGVLVLLFGLKYFETHFNVVQFEQWNFMYSSITDAGFLIAGLGFAKGIRVLQRWENHKYDKNL
jgi:hypothetical protein